jgi:hypothetical protein
VYYREGATSANTLTIVTTGVLGTFSTGAFVEVANSASSGLYMFGLTNASLGTSVTTGTVEYFISASAGTNPVYFKIHLTEFDMQNGANAALTALPTNSAGTTGGVALVGVQIPSASYGFTGGLSQVGKQIPTATAGAVGGLILIGDQVPTASAGLSNGLPVVGKQIPTGTAGASSGLPLLGLQVPTATAGATGGLLTSTSFTAASDNLLDRDMSLGTDSGSATTRTVRQALRFLRNKWVMTTTGTLTVFKEDDVSTSWTSTVSTNSNAIGVVSIDPAG